MSGQSMTSKQVDVVAPAGDWNVLQEEHKSMQSFPSTGRKIKCCCNHDTQEAFFGRLPLGG